MSALNDKELSGSLSSLDSETGSTISEESLVVQNQPVNGNFQQQSGSSSSPGIPMSSNGNNGNVDVPNVAVNSEMYPRAILSCRQNSHPFQDRTLILNQAVKVGRSVARAKPSPSNAIFDCKVLSRNHALIWYENGKFYLQDTKSSNGTFVNNQRLSKGSEESLPREVCSGDILQFGVDVMENSRKVTHGCIIATLKLYLPDGKEAKASPTIMSSPLGATLPPQDLYLLNQYIQEALAREQLLQTKLAVLQQLVGQTEVASSNAWKSLIDEDRLLTRVEILESQLSAYSKSMTEDKLREEAQRLLEEKEKYQEVTKQTIRKLCDDKLKVVKRTEDLEKQLVMTQEELIAIKGLYEKETEENRKLVDELSKLNTELIDAKKIASEQEQQLNDEKQRQLQENQNAKNEETTQSDQNEETQLNEKPSEWNKQENSENIATQSTGLQREETECVDDTGLKEEIAKAYVEVQFLQEKVGYLEQENEKLQSMVNESGDRNVVVTEEHVDLSKRERRKAEDDLEQSRELNSEDAKEITDENMRLKAQVEALQQELFQIYEKKRDVEQELYEVKEISSSRLPLVDSSTSSDLNLDDSRLTQLLKVKEKYTEVSEINAQLETSLNQLESEFEALNAQSQAATACSLVPLGVLFIAFIIAYLPFLSSFFGTADEL